jgi:RNA polymerase sigma-70 factor (ECF subfamily)
MKDEDTELIKKAQAGDRSAFEALLREHYDVMFRMAFKWCGNRADAEDITQNACLKLARSIGGFRFESAFTSWLYRLVVNAAMDWKKANKTHGEIPETMPGGSADAEQDMQTKEGLALVLALPEKEKTALLLVFGEGMTHAEAAFVMECKESTVSWYIHEARKRLGVETKKRGIG